MTDQNQNTSGKPPRAPSSAASVAAAAAAIGASAPCAACKHEQRLCTARYCVLAPYFPADDPPEDFNNVLRLFGVDRVTTLLRKVPLESRLEAAESIIYEASARADDPVGGCWAVIRQLRRQIEAGEAELRMVQERIASFKNQENMLPLKKRKL